MAVISKVEIFRNNTLFHTITAPPFDKYVAPPMAAGTYTFYSKIYVDGALAVTTPVRNITIEPYVSTSLLTGIISRYDFAETSGNFIDSIGGHNAFIAYEKAGGGLTRGVAGVGGGTAVSFDQARIEIPSTDNHSFADYDNNELAGTVSIWVKLTEYRSASMIIGKRWEDRYEREWQIRNISGTIEFKLMEPGFDDNDYISVSIPETSLTLGKFHMITATTDGTKTNTGLKLSVDKTTPVQTYSANTTYTGMKPTGSNVVLGNAPWSGSWIYKGGYDALYIDRGNAWTDAQRDAHYDNILAGGGTAPTDPSGDTAAPLFNTGFPTTANTGSTITEIRVQLNEVGKAFAVVLPDGATPPTSAQVKAGTGAGGSAPVFAGNVDIIAANNTRIINVTGMAAGTPYDIYVVAQDDEATPNLQASPTKLDISTTGSGGGGGATTYDTDFQAVLDYATANGIAHPVTIEKDFLNQKIIDLKTNGAWAKLGTLFYFGGTASIAFKSICLKRRISGIAADLISASTGFKGKALAGSKFDTQWRPKDDTLWGLNNASVFHYVSTLVSGTKVSYGLQGNNGAQVTLMGNRTGSTNIVAINDGHTISQVFEEAGLNMLCRTSSVASVYRAPSKETGFSVDALAIPDGTAYMSLFSRNGNLPSDVEIKWWGAGSDMSVEYAGLKTILT